MRILDFLYRWWNGEEQVYDPPSPAEIRTSSPLSQPDSPIPVLPLPVITPSPLPIQELPISTISPIILPQKIIMPVIPLSPALLAIQTLNAASTSSNSKKKDEYTALVTKTVKQPLIEENHALADELLTSYYSYLRRSYCSDSTSKIMSVIKKTYLDIAGIASGSTIAWLDNKAEQYAEQYYEEISDTDRGEAVRVALAADNQDALGYLATKQFSIWSYSSSDKVNFGNGKGVEMILQAVRNNLGHITRSYFTEMLKKAAKEGMAEIATSFFALGGEIPKEELFCTFAAPAIRPLMKELYLQQAAFLKAAGTGDIDGVKRGFDVGISPNLWDSEPIWRAAKAGDVTMLRLFKSRHEQVSFPENLIQTAIKSQDIATIMFVARDGKCRWNYGEIFAELMNSQNNIAAAATLVPLMSERDTNGYNIGASIVSQIQRNPAFPADFPIFALKPWSFSTPDVLREVIKAERADILLSCLRAGIVPADNSYHPDNDAMCKDLLRTAFHTNKRSVVAATLALCREKAAMECPPISSPEIKELYEQGNDLQAAVTNADIKKLQAILLKQSREYVPYTRLALNKAVQTGQQISSFALIDYITLREPAYNPPINVLRMASSDELLIGLIKRGGKDDENHSLLIHTIEKNFPKSRALLNAKSVDWSKEEFTNHFDKMVEKNNIMAVEFYAKTSVNKDYKVIKAASAGHGEIVSILVAANCDKVETYNRAAIDAAEHGWVDTVKRLLGSGKVTINIFHNKMNCRLIEHQLMVDFLVDNGVIINKVITPQVRSLIAAGQQPKEKLTAEHMVDAASYGLLSVVKYIASTLPDNYSSAEHKDWINKAATSAARDDRREVALWLTVNGASKEDALEIAVIHNHEKLAELLLHQGADVIETLKYAFKHNNVNILRLALQQQVNNGEPFKSEDLLMMAKDEHSECREVLELYKAWEEIPENHPQKKLAQRIWNTASNELSPEEWRYLASKEKATIPKWHLQSLLLRGAMSVMQEKGVTGGIAKQIGSYLDQRHAFAMSTLNKSAAMSSASFIERYQIGVAKQMRENPGRY